MRLSIVIPCYNCADTLREAVDLCFAQSLASDEFEIVMVDDGSTDSTRDLMASLASEHSNIRLFYHEVNRGGGAARNTGIHEAQGEIIYCLDSDNFFASNSLRPILDYFTENQVDAVAFYERRFFYGNNQRKYTSHFNKKLGLDITLEDLFTSDGGGTLLDNFFYTKASYLRTAGYPEHHGFDTQCFELRFIAAGNSVRVCSESIFYHRQNKQDDSYFQRVYKSGHFSRNYYLIYEDIIHLLSPAVRRTLIEFDIFANSKLDASNLKATLDRQFKANPAAFFIAGKEKFMHERGRNEFYESVANSSLPEDLFACSVIDYTSNRHEAALGHLTKLLQQGINSKVLYFNLLRVGLALTNTTEKARIEGEVEKLAEHLRPQRQTFSKRARLLGKLKRAFLR